MGSRIFLKAAACVLTLIAVLFAADAHADDWNGIALPEEARYNLTYFGILAGHASIRLEKIDYSGRPALKVTAKVWSTPFFSLFYRVQDEIVSILDPETLRPYEHNINYQEGTYRRITHYRFDYEKGECLSEEDPVGIVPDVLDPAGALFFLRIQDLSLVKTMKRSVCDGRKTQELEARVVGEKKIATLFGQEQAVIVKPELKDIRREGATKERQDVTLYFLPHRKNLPCLVTGKLVIGSLVARLTEVKNK
jgi:hypothetical protein